MNNVFTLLVGISPICTLLRLKNFSLFFSLHCAVGLCAPILWIMCLDWLGYFEHQPVSVDYGITPRKLFLDVLENVQHSTQKLDFLSCSWINYSSSVSPSYRNQFDLPAWAIDWSWRTRYVHPIPLANSKDSQRILWDTYYAASGDSKYNMKFDRV